MNVKHNDQMVPKLLSIFISKDLHFCGDYFTFISPNFIILAISNLLIKPCIIIKSFLWPIFLRIKKVSRHIVIIHLCNFNYIIFFMLIYTKRLIIQIKIRLWCLFIFPNLIRFLLWFIIMNFICVFKKLLIVKSRFFIISFAKSIFPNLFGTFKCSLDVRFMIGRAKSFLWFRIRGRLDDWTFIV